MSTSASDTETSRGSSRKRGKQPSDKRPKAKSLPTSKSKQKEPRQQQGGVRFQESKNTVLEGSQQLFEEVQPEELWFTEEELLSFMDIEAAVEKLLKKGIVSQTSFEALQEVYRLSDKTTGEILDREMKSKFNRFYKDTKGEVSGLERYLLLDQSDIAARRLEMAQEVKALQNVWRGQDPNERAKRIRKKCTAVSRQARVFAHHCAASLASTVVPRNTTTNGKKKSSRSVSVNMGSTPRSALMSSSTKKRTSGKRRQLSNAI